MYFNPSALFSILQLLILVDCDLKAACNALVLIAKERELVWHFSLDVGYSGIDLLTATSCTAIVEDNRVLR